MYNLDSDAGSALRAAEWKLGFTRSCVVLLLNEWPVTPESDVGINDIYISQDDPVIRPPSLRNNKSAGYASFVPSFNCTVRWRASCM